LHNKLSALLLRPDGAVKGDRCDLIRWLLVLVLLGMVYIALSCEQGWWQGLAFYSQILRL